MANIHNLFSSFNTAISLTDAKAKCLRTSRDALREVIRDWFSNNDKQNPKFCWQGSFAMKTTINPINDGEYDIDDGVYLSGYSDADSSEWPATTTVHNWVVEAVESQTKSGVVNKDTCVRVIYASGYHVDLPIYIEQGGAIYLAHKTKGWTISDPKAFRDWFTQKIRDNDEQLRRLVKYLKAWKDYKSVPLKGIEITILAVNNFHIYEGHDEKSLCSTLQSIIESLESSFTCKKPVAPFEDLFEEISETKRSNILRSMKDLKEALDKAIKEEDQLTASQYMINVFGDRFPKGKPANKAETNTSYVRTAAPGVLKHDGRSA